MKEFFTDMTLDWYERINLLLIFITAVVTIWGISLVIRQTTGIHSGTITNKSVYPAHLQLIGKTSIMIPDQYTLSVRDGNQDNFIYVPRETYESVRVGQWYDNQCGCAR